jgi:hypothetical protein
LSAATAVAASAAPPTIAAIRALIIGPPSEIERAPEVYDGAAPLGHGAVNPR